MSSSRKFIKEGNLGPETLINMVSASYTNTSVRASQRPRTHKKEKNIIVCDRLKKGGLPKFHLLLEKGSEKKGLYRFFHSGICKEEGSRKGRPRRIYPLRSAGGEKGRNSKPPENEEEVLRDRKARRAKGSSSSSGKANRRPHESGGGEKRLGQSDRTADL